MRWNGKIKETPVPLRKMATNVSFLKVFDQSGYIKDSIGELTRMRSLGAYWLSSSFSSSSWCTWSAVIAFPIPSVIFVGFLIMSAVVTITY